MCTKDGDDKLGALFSLSSSPHKTQTHMGKAGFFSSQTGEGRPAKRTPEKGARARGRGDYLACARRNAATAPLATVGPTAGPSTFMWRLR